MKKILYITLRADFGGGPEHLLGLIKNISEKYDIYVAAPKDCPYWERYEDIIGGAKMFELPHRSFKISSLKKMIAFASKNDICVLHSHGKGAGV